MDAVEIRVARVSDAPAIAHLHRTRISEGFLSSLGERFLTRLYRRIILSDGGYAAVAINHGSEVVGMSALAVNVAHLYKQFIVKDGLVAGFISAPRILRSLPRVWETLRYPSTAEGLPDAEVLSVAVSDDVAGRGVGRALLASTLRECELRGLQAVKVVAGTDNTAALALYRASGFVLVETMQVHAGTNSSVLVWRNAHPLHIVAEDHA